MRGDPQERQCAHEAKEEGAPATLLVSSAAAQVYAAPEMASGADAAAEALVRK